MKRTTLSTIHSLRCLFLLAVLLPMVALAQQSLAPHSRLANGHWVKISIPETGIYQLSDSLLVAAGFSNPQQVKIYGYGGALQPEKLETAYPTATDDLPQVPLCHIGGQRLFLAYGPVNWEKSTSTARTRNPYANAGCYFLTDTTDEDALLVDSAQMSAAWKALPNIYHSLYEVDDFSWYPGGRNLYDSKLFGPEVAHSYKLPAVRGAAATVTVVMSYNNYCDATVALGDLELGHILIDANTTKGAGRKQYMDQYMRAAVDEWTFQLPVVLSDSVTITIQQLSGRDMRLDRIELTSEQSRPMPLLSTTTFPHPTVMGAIANQDRHADEAADMIIIVASSAHLMQQAERLAQMHRDFDHLRVRVVKADELYNEFSSGTPDANAYRRYLKMLYDRAESEADKPRFLLLFGDAIYDNRMCQAEFSNLSPNDFLLCYESDNSMSETACYVSDDFFGMLDNGEGADIVKNDKLDVAVGRIPARTVEEAKTAVDKAYGYRLNEQYGAWQNIICMMGDDGNANMHMNDAEIVAGIINENWPAYNVKKIYWDAYERTESALGHAYPDVGRLIRQQMLEGALLMNYSGHGSTYMLSHENVIDLSDFKAPTSLRLPVWFTASCDVAPFESNSQETIGEQALFNPAGGAIAFLGTTRTVYAIHNRAMNKAFTTHVLETNNGEPRTIGEAVRLAKNEQVLGQRTQLQAGINRLHFALLGDPALRLPLPTARAVIDSINGESVADGAFVALPAGSVATVKGHIEGHPDFNGMASLTVKGAEQTIVCRMNPQQSDEEPKAPLTYRDRPSTLFTGSDSVSNGSFAFTFAVPRDADYGDNGGLMLVHATSTDHSIVAHGLSDAFAVVSADAYAAEGSGPVIKAWLEYPDFAEGGLVGAEPLLHAEITDDDGINVSDAGIGHQIELCIDGRMEQTYWLNSYFAFDFGDFRSGTLEYRLPHLSDGLHELQLRAWDVFNHASTLTLGFTVQETADPMAKPTGISDVERSTLNAQRYFDLQGRSIKQLNGHQPAIIVRRTPDGLVRKKIVRRQ
ncbi:MAG: type IX secretion system sortase PorU [Prevotella sp.]|nr:type IX secretion system sortase PorU [Prevotella sp.]